MTTRLLIVRLLLLAAAWLVMTEGGTSGGGVAALALAAATAASALLLPAPVARWRLSGLARFVPFFLRQSLAGGVDVARRALAPSHAVRPTFVTFELRLPDGPSRRFFVAATGLLPGTLTARLDGNEARVHALDAALPVTDTLRALEVRTADLFGLPPFE
jgi:multicomponent Na+:H+ antiporter subunit E